MSPQTEASSLGALVEEDGTMSTRELERVVVMGRVAQEGLELVGAAAMLQLSHRKVKRMW